MNVCKIIFFTSIHISSRFAQWSLCSCQRGWAHACQRLRWVPWWWSSIAGSSFRYRVDPLKAQLEWVDHWSTGPLDHWTIGPLNQPTHTWLIFHLPWHGKDALLWLGGTRIEKSGTHFLSRTISKGKFSIISCWAGWSHWHDKGAWTLVSYSWILFKNGVCISWCFWRQLQE